MLVITYSNVSGSKWEQLWAEIRWRRRRRRTYVKQFLFDVPYKSKCEMKLAATMDEREIIITSCQLCIYGGDWSLIFNLQHFTFFFLWNICFVFLNLFCSVSFFLSLLNFFSEGMKYCVSMKYLPKISKHLLYFISMIKLYI